MLLWFFRRLIQSLLLIFVLLTAVFFVVRLAPGDPLDQAIEEEQNASDREMMRQRLGLDEPLAAQYQHWLSGALSGDLGFSLSQQRPVTEIIAEAMGPTLVLTVTSYFLILVLAIGSALVMVQWRGGAVDHILQTVGLAFYSAPSFWLALMMILLFSRHLGWFPVGGLESPDAAFLSSGERFLDRANHLVLPVATLVLGGFVGTARYLRAALEDVLNQDYIYAARARGLSSRRVLLGHGLRNGLLPLITLMGLSVPFLLGGALIIEVVFGWPGMGRVTIEAIWARDYPVIMATTIISGVAVVLGSTLADVLYRWADPRLQVPDYAPKAGAAHGHQ